MTINLSSKEKHDLKRFIKTLNLYSGSHTELVSVYVPTGYDLIKIISHLQDEQGTATNIKSSATRKNVIDALERMIQHLKLVGTTPPNGLAAFSGNISDKPGQSNVQVFSYEPPIPLNIRIYRCDKTFVTEPLEEVANNDNVYALVVVDRRDGVIALLRGTKIQVLLKTHSEVPGKTRAGGQSAPRFARLREGAAKQHYKKIADYMTQELLEIKELKGIIVGGPSITVTDFIAQGQITGQLKDKILGTKDLSYTDEFGLQELLDKSQDILAEENIAEEKGLMQRFFTHLAKKPDMVTYGIDYVKRALEMSAVDVLLISESLDDDESDELEKMGDESGAKVVYVSVDVREGQQLKDIGKVAAILRFPVEL